jgi:hypothetical protein
MVLLISAPEDFVVDYGARFDGTFRFREFKNLFCNVLETIHGINVGGLKITPFNDAERRHESTDHTG